MQDRKPGPAPEQTPKMSEIEEGLDDSRIPGTRRLYVAGALVVAVVTATVTSISILDRSGQDSSQERLGHTTSAAEPIVPDFSVDVPAAEPSGKSGLSSPESTHRASPDGSRSTKTQQRGSDPAPSKPAASSKPPAEKPSYPQKSVQSVNYPDRFWHVSGGEVLLDAVSSGSSEETRRDSTFSLAPGLADSDCYSFSTGEGDYLHLVDFSLSAGRDDGSALFEDDATFCPLTVYPGAVTLEAYSYPGWFLRHKNFRLRLDPYENSGLYQADSTFQLVAGLD